MTTTNKTTLPNRRNAVKAAAIGGAAIAITNTMTSNPAQAATKDEAVKTDKQCIMEAGLTEAEADCWAKIADAAGSFFKLPQLHPEDAKEVAAAIHVVQNKLLGRPTYRKYLEVAKANQALKNSLKTNEQ